jgi:L-alanine-DL-glutamate epimerase-like enolase superfamily enzyme
MRISSLRTFRADGGWRPFSFLRIETDQGIIGWSEFSEGAWAPGLADVIRALGEHVLGADPRAWGLISARMRSLTQFTAGGLSHQAQAAIENACLDIAAKAAGVPVYRLFGGPLRQQVELYWSHCGSFRVRHPELFETVLSRPRITRLSDIQKLGNEAAERGVRAVKTNPIAFDASGPVLLNPGFVPHGLNFGRTLDEVTLAGIVAQCLALRAGLGPTRGLMLDVNFSLHPGALRRLGRALTDVGLRWLEADIASPAALASVRSAAVVPIASLESLHGRQSYQRFLDANAVDIAIVDILWNGLAESVRIAALCETHGVNVAPHNFYGPLADLMSAHFSAAVPNFEVMEIEGDDVPWKYQLLTRVPEQRDGCFVIPETPGWGADIDEVKLAAHPWPRA